jgi:hypothetical protein
MYITHSQQLKVGADVDEDVRRVKLMRSIIDDPANMPTNRPPVNPKSLEGKNAGPTGCVMMVDSNRKLELLTFLLRPNISSSPTGRQCGIRMWRN